MCLIPKKRLDKTRFCYDIKLNHNIHTIFHFLFAPFFKLVPAINASVTVTKNQFFKLK